MMMMMMMIMIIIIIIFTAFGLSPVGSDYFTCKQNMKLVTTKFKLGGLREKHVVATWNLGNHLSICGTISAFAEPSQHLEEPSQHLRNHLSIFGTISAFAGTISAFAGTISAFAEPSQHLRNHLNI